MSLFKNVIDNVKLYEEAESSRYTYRTNFHLNVPVNDYEKAKAYLEEDDMVQYFKDRANDELRNKVISIDWVLEDDESGYIQVVTNSVLTDEEQKEISDWIAGQNSDGLGEGFEQQPFAESYYDPINGDGPYTYQEAIDEIEKKLDNLSVQDLVDEGYLDDDISGYVEQARDEYPEDTEGMSDSEVEDFIKDNIYDFIEESSDEYYNARDKYAKDYGDEYNENKWYTMSSFDWKTNPYELELVDTNEEVEEEPVEEEIEEVKSEENIQPPIDFSKNDKSNQPTEEEKALIEKFRANGWI